MKFQPQKITNWENYTGISKDNGVAFSDDCTGYRVPQKEREALIAIYNAIKEDASHYVWNFWDSDPTSLSNVGSWNGVTTGLVNGQKHVIELDINYSRINGDVPKELGDLTELTKLKFGDGNGSQITSLPSEIGNLKKVITLSVHRGDLTTLPTEIGDMDALVSLELHGNELASLPAGIGNFKSLESLNLSGQTKSSEKTLTSNCTSWDRYWRKKKCAKTITTL